MKPSNATEITPDARADIAPIQETPANENAPKRKETLSGDRLDELAQRLDAIADRLDRIADQRNTQTAELLDAKDAAHLLGLARSTFLSRCNTGEIAPAPIRIGGRVSWRRSELIDWLDAGCPARAIWAARRESQN